MLSEILRDFKFNKKFHLFFIINLSFGLIGLVGLLGFKSSFQESINKRSRNILGSDLALSSRSKFSDEKIKEIERLLPKNFTKISRISMFSMLKAENKTRLVNVKTLPNGFPFYGEMQFTKPMERSDQFSNGKTVWIYPEIATQMNLGLGDKISLGHAEFIIENIVEKDPQQSFQMGAMAPRVFMSPEGELKAKLFQKGSTAFHSIHYKLNEYVEVKPLAKKIEDLFTEVGPKVLTPEKTGEQVGRFLQYLSDFLGLVSLVALFLSSVGLFYLFRSFISRKRKEMAIYLALGRTKKQLRKYYISYLMLLGLAGTLIGLVAGNLLFFSLSSLISKMFTFNMSFHLDYEFTLLAFIIGTLGTFLIGFPLLQRGLSSGANDLFQEDMRQVNLKPGLSWFIPWLIFYWGVGIVVSHSVKIGSLFFGLFFLQGLIGVALLYPFFKFLEKISSKFALSTKHALLYLSRHKASSMAAFLAIAQGVLLLTLIPQIRAGLNSELDDVDGSKIPTLFLFDIQEEQVKDVNNFFKDKKTPLQGITPMVRGRITKINDQEFARPEGRALTREEEREFRFRNRGANLSYRSDLHESETIISGRPFIGSYDPESDKLPELSIETRYAKRLGISLGDKVSFEILGMPIDGKVVSIRKVKWTSFHPNFFIMFQPGVLDDAPKTFLGVSDQLSVIQKNSIQIDLFEKFPNISVVDITRVVERILVVLSQMSVAMGAMAVLSLLAGLFVLYSLISHQVDERSKDAGLFKMMGFGANELRSTIVKEFVILTFTASFFGSLGSIIISFVLAKVVFDGLWVPILSLPIIVTLVLGLIAAALSWYSSKNVFKMKTIDLVRPFS
ncbi:MAG: FtsX-like permease family protein [Bacteriovoracaceae bacterium]|nr:FtsX-like permease family protein [Bacteriovoracaceae bacterium]